MQRWEAPSSRIRRRSRSLGRRSALVLLTAGVSIVAIGLTVSAHRLVAIDEAFPSPLEALRIETLDISQVAYVELTPEAPELWLVFEVAEPMDLHLSLGIPELERLTDFRPRLSVVREPTGEEFATFDTSDIVAPEAFYEPFTGTSSWILVDETLPILEPGTYYVRASASPSAADKLWVAVGRSEVFGWDDIFSFPSVVRDVRAFHEAEPRLSTPLQWAELAGFVVLGIIVVVAAIHSAQSP